MTRLERRLLLEQLVRPRTQPLDQVVDTYLEVAQDLDRLDALVGHEPSPAPCPFCADAGCAMCSARSTILRAVAAQREA